MTRRRALPLGVPAAWCVAAVAPVRAQAREPLPLVVLVSAGTRERNAPYAAAFVDGMREAGHVDGTTYRLDVLHADGSTQRIEALTRDALALQPAVVVVTGLIGARIARNLTATTPIVVATASDLADAGLVHCLARPGGNVTGFSTLVPELSAKQLALLAEMVPGLARVAMFGDSGEAGNAQSVSEAEAAATRLNLRLQYLDLRRAGGPPMLFAAAARQDAGAVLALASAYLFARQHEVAALALERRLPAIYAHGEAVRGGGLATYGVGVMALFRRAAGYVVEILGGARPADLPVEQPTRLEFVINMTTAKALGLTIPQSVLLRADEVIA